MNRERRRALITGLTGQDGSFLAEQLLADGYEVIGLVREEPGAGLGCAEHLQADVQRIAGDLLSPDTLVTAVKDLAPDELYHLAAPTFVPESWQDPAQTMAAIAGGTAALLQAVGAHSPHSRVLVAGSGEMFGDAPESPQREDTPCRPRTPYAAAKLASHQLVGLMRGHSGVFACSAILFNHESERRPPNFVTRKITRAAASIKLGLSNELTLGDTSASRDWSFAPDVMRGCRLMLGQSGPATTSWPAASAAPSWSSSRPRSPTSASIRSCHVRTDPDLVRPPETTPPVGDPGRARRELGWAPTLTFEQLVARMVDADLAELSAAPAPPSR